MSKLGTPFEEAADAIRREREKEEAAAKADASTIVFPPLSGSSIWSRSEERRKPLGMVDGNAANLRILQAYPLSLARSHEASESQPAPNVGNDMTHIVNETLPDLKKTLDPEA